MALDAFPVWSNIPGLYLWNTFLVGADGAALTPSPSTLDGQGGTVHARTGEGVYTLRFTESPGRFICVLAHQFLAATMADIDDYNLGPDTWDSSTLTLTYTVYANTTAADLLVNQYLGLTLAFQRP